MKSDSERMESCFEFWFSRSCAHGLPAAEIAMTIGRKIGPRRPCYRSGRMGSSGTLFFRPERGRLANHATPIRGRRSSRETPIHLHGEESPKRLGMDRACQCAAASGRAEPGTQGCTSATCPGLRPAPGPSRPPAPSRPPPSCRARHRTGSRDVPRPAIPVSRGRLRKARSRG